MLSVAHSRGRRAGAGAAAIALAMGDRERGRGGATRARRREQDLEAEAAVNAAFLARGEEAVAHARRAVEGHRTRLEGEIAELRAIREAQIALGNYREFEGVSDEEVLDPRLCLGSALRPLCPELVKTFGVVE